MKRCAWTSTDPLMIEYHDKEWGTPVHDDRTHFEFLVLESAQAGLSWMTVLKKRENYRAAFDNFDPEKVALYTERDIERFLQNPGLIRNRKKLEAAVNNAKRFLEIQKEFKSFDNYIWGFVDGKPLVNAFTELGRLPANTPLSDKVSKDLKQRGFKFLGTTIIYSHLQAVGIINDHTTDCFRYKELTGGKQ